MGWFEHIPTLHLLERERDPSRIASAAKLRQAITHDIVHSDVRTFLDKVNALSPVPLEKDVFRHTNVNGNKYFHKAVFTTAALKLFTEKDLSDPAKRSNYRTLRQLQFQAAELARGRGRKDVLPTGADKRRYNPAGKRFAATIYGTRAALGVFDRVAPAFLLPHTVVPCIQRKARREVLFAKRKAGRGYRVRHRRNWSSGIPC